MRKIWKSIIQLHLDYACILWQPVSRVMEIRKMENPLRSFTQRIPSLRLLPYHDRLRILKLQSQQRRSERYRILYMRKMILGLVPNIGISIEKGTRFGDIINIGRKKCVSEKIMRLRDDSLMIEGAKLYNSVPMNIRSYDGTYLGFKNLVDKWLTNIPDIPRVSGFEPRSRNMIGEPSNSVRDWVKCEDISRMNVWTCNQFMTKDSDDPYFD